MSRYLSLEQLGPLEDWIPNAAALHAISVHIPVALSMVGVLVVLAAMFIPKDGPALRRFTIAFYILLALSAFYAVETGEDAKGKISGELAGSIWDGVEKHDWFAEKVMYFALATAVIVLFSFFGDNVFRRWMMAFALIASIATATWTGMTGHFGGDLVYKDGVGVERVVNWKIVAPGSAAPAPSGETAPAEPEENEALISISDIDMGEAAKVSFKRDVMEIFEEACLECHQPGDLDSELDMTTVAGLLKGGEKYGTSIVPGKPDESTTIKYVRGILRPQMPEDEFPLDEEQVHILRMWIAAGAKDDS